MKIAINACYGGFHLTGEAIYRISKRKGCEVFPYYYDWENKKYLKVDPKYFEVNPNYADYFVTKDFGREVSTEEDAFYDALLPSFSRTDPDLIAVVEEMGVDASDSCSLIKVVEIPDDVDWEFEEFDGREWIAEKHRRWS